MIIQNIKDEELSVKIKPVLGYEKITDPWTNTFE